MYWRQSRLRLGALSGAFVELAGETGVTVPFKKHVGKYCKHCVRSDCAKQPLPSARLKKTKTKHQRRSKQQRCRATHSPPAGNKVDSSPFPPHSPPPDFFLYRFCTKIQVENHDTLKSPLKSWRRQTWVCFFFVCLSVCLSCF